MRQDYHDKTFEIASQEATINKLKSEVKMARHNLDNVFNRLGVQLLRGRQVRGEASPAPSEGGGVAGALSVLSGPDSFTNALLCRSRSRGRSWP